MPLKYVENGSEEKNIKKKGKHSCRHHIYKYEQLILN